MSDVLECQQTNRTDKALPWLILANTKFCTISEDLTLSVASLFQRKRVKCGVVVPWDTEGAPQSHSLLLFQGMGRALTALGSQGAFIHGYKTCSGGHWSARPQSPQQEGEQTVLGLGFTRSVPCHVNGYFLPLSFPLGMHQPEHLMRGIPLPIPSDFPSSWAPGVFQVILH